MTPETKSTTPVPAGTRPAAVVNVAKVDEVVLATVSGLVDERFAGFGQLGEAKTLVIDVIGVTRMTSFGVRQWLKGMDKLPKSVTNLYLLGCPTFFVDQLNMVLNFGGPAKVLTVVAPYTCPSCGVESGEMIDVLSEYANLTLGIVPDKECGPCGGKLEFDETPESYFAFVKKYGATVIEPAVALLLAKRGRYSSPDNVTQKPPRVVKLVHGTVTYFRIIGTIDSMFRARPFLVGTEGEVVIDLAEVERFDPTGKREWQRLLESLAVQLPVTTLVDIPDSFLAAAGDTLAVVPNLALASVLVPYCCIECGRTSTESVDLVNGRWPRDFPEQACTKCRAMMRSELVPEDFAPWRSSFVPTPPESARVIKQRAELISGANGEPRAAHSGPIPTTSDVVLGNYQLIRKLSAGGMAEVFLANQIGIGGFEKPVALKRIQHHLLGSRRQAIELFLNEAKIAGRLMHPNIVQVLDVGEVGGALFLAMEFVHGHDLREVAKALRAQNLMMPIGEACYVVREVAQALDHAYWSSDSVGKRLSVVHRDVSPHNIILGYDGTVKLLDFGVAMSAITEHAETLIVGKWTYMSPETTMNGKTDHRSDLFSLGVIFYMLCSGSVPFSGSEPREIVRKIRGGHYKSLAEVAPNVPERLARLVARMLAPNPDQRVQRAAEVVTELNEIMRAHRIECAGPAIAELLSTVIPPAGAAPDFASVKKFVRVPADERAHASFTTGTTGATGTTGEHDFPSTTPTTGARQIANVSEPFRRIAPRPSQEFRRARVPAPRRRERIINMAIISVIAVLLGVVVYLFESSY